MGLNHRETEKEHQSFAASIEIMPQHKSKGSRSAGQGNGAHRGRSDLREAWAGGNYSRTSVSPDGSAHTQDENPIPFRLAMWDLGQCDKKRCTGTKLVRQHIVSELRLGIPFPGVILSPNGKCCVSNDDKELIGVKGLAVVDCSWNKLDEVPFGKYSQPTLQLASDLIILTNYYTAMQAGYVELLHDCYLGLWLQIPSTMVNLFIGAEQVLFGTQMCGMQRVLLCPSPYPF